MVDVHLVGHVFADHIARVDDLRAETGQWLGMGTRVGGIATVERHLPESLSVAKSVAHANALVLTDGHNKRSYTRFFERVTPKLDVDARWCHIAYLDQVRPSVEEMRALRERSMILSCDLVDVPADEEFAELLKMADYLFVSYELYDHLKSNDIAWITRGLGSNGPRLGAFIHSPESCCLATTENRSETISNEHLKPLVDNVGAGDIFAARIIAEKLDDRYHPIEECIRAAHKYTAAVLGERR